MVNANIFDEVVQGPLLTSLKYPKTNTCQPMKLFSQMFVEVRDEMVKESQVRDLSAEECHARALETRELADWSPDQQRYALLVYVADEWERLALEKASTATCSQSQMPVRFS